MEALNLSSFQSKTHGRCFFWNGLSSVHVLLPFGARIPCDSIPPTFAGKDLRSVVFFPLRAGVAARAWKRCSRIHHDQQPNQTHQSRKSTIATRMCPDIVNTTVFNVYMIALGSCYTITGCHGVASPRILIHNQNKIPQGKWDKLQNITFSSCGCLGHWSPWQTFRTWPSGSSNLAPPRRGSGEHRSRPPHHALLGLHRLGIHLPALEIEKCVFCLETKHVSKKKYGETCWD